MPELPEVETIRRSLLPFIIGHRIGRVLTDTPGVFADPDPDRITGLFICGIRRRGKYLMLYLAPDHCSGLSVPDRQEQLAAWLMIHLRMTGRLTLQASEQPVKKHTHVRIELFEAATRTTSWLMFQDTRRFGRLWLQQAASADTDPACLVHLGPEPLDPPVTADILARHLLRHPRLSLKAALLDQSVIAGIGNIYADEILFAAGLPPDRTVAGLTQPDLEQLSVAIPTVLSKAIDLCGITLRDYVDGWNRKGSFQDCLMVYGRTGLPCLTCGHQILKKKLAGRSTHWCPVCQPQ